MKRIRGLSLGLIMVMVVMLTACQSGSKTPVVGSAPPPSPQQDFLRRPTTTDEPDVTKPTIASKPGTVTTITTTPDTIISPPSGEPEALPDASRTPGAINSSVTQSNISTTICVSGYTSTIRPPASYTTDLKIRQLNSGYNVGGDVKTGDYEEDHLISLELGGNPADEKNLWPQPHDGVDGVKNGSQIKDGYENFLHKAVCDGTKTLAEAQDAVAHDWLSHYLADGRGSITFGGSSNGG